MINTSQGTAEPLLGFDVNLTHNFVHLLTGLLGLGAAAAGAALSLTYALVLGVVYILVGIWGMLDSDPLGLFAHINPADNVLHFAIGALGLAAFAASRAVRTDTSTRSRR